MDKYGPGPAVPKLCRRILYERGRAHKGVYTNALELLSHIASTSNPQRVYLSIFHAVLYKCTPRVAETPVQIFESDVQ